MRICFSLSFTEMSEFIVEVRNLLGKFQGLCLFISLS